MRQRIPDFINEKTIAWFLLLSIIGIGFSFRINAATEPIWLDECHTMWTVDAGSLAEVIDRAAIGNQPPLYFLIVWCVTKAIGLSVFSVRLISLIAGSLLILIAAIWCQRLTQRWAAAVLVAGLISFDGQFAFYASESRSYALVQLLGILQAIAFWRLLRQQSSGNARPTMTWHWVAWTALSISLLYCHYTSIWIIAAESMIVMAVTVRERSFQFAIRFATSTALAIGTLIPNWWNLSLVYGRRENWGSVSRLGLLWEDVNPWLVHWVVIPAGFAIAWWIVTVIVGHHRESSTKVIASWILPMWILTWLAIGPLGIAAASWFQIAPMALVRYSCVCWVAFALFAGICVSPFSRFNAWLIAATIFACSFFGNWWVTESLQQRGLIPFRTEDWVEVVKQIDDAKTKLPVFQFADVIEDIDAFEIDDAAFQQYLLFPILGAQAASDRGIDLSDDQSLHAMPSRNRRFQTKHLDEVRDAEGCWMVVRGERNFALDFPILLEDQLGEKIQFRLIPNKRMSWSQVHLIRVRTIDDP